MPFKSQAQRGFMYANHPKMAKEFEEATPEGEKLPEHLSTGGETPVYTGIPPVEPKPLNPLEQLINKIAMQDPKLRLSVPSPTGKDIPGAMIGHRFSDGGEVKPRSDIGNLRGLQDIMDRKARGENIHEAPKNDPEKENEEGSFMGEFNVKASTGPKHYADGGDVLSNPLGSAVSAGMGGLQAANNMPINEKLDALRSIIAASGMEPMSTMASMTPSPQAPTPSPRQPMPINPPPPEQPMAPPQSAPPIGQAMQALNKTPDTNYDFYGPISADKRAALYQQLLAKQAGPGNLAAQAVGGIGDSISNAFGKGGQHSQDEARAIAENNTEKRIGAVDTQRQQKMQDMNANIEMQMADPNSNISRSMQKTLQAAGLNVPAGMPGKVMLQVAGPLGELAMKQATVAEMANYHKAEIGQKKEALGVHEQEFQTEHPFLTWLNNVQSGGAGTAQPPAIGASVSHKGATITRVK